MTYIWYGLYIIGWFVTAVLIANSDMKSTGYNRGYNTMPSSIIGMIGGIVWPFFLLASIIGAIARRI